MAKATPPTTDSVMQHQIYRYAVDENGAPTGDLDENGNPIPEEVEIFTEQVAPAITLYGRLSDLRYFNPGYFYYSVPI